MFANSRTTRREIRNCRISSALVLLMCVAIAGGLLLCTHESPTLSALLFGFLVLVSLYFGYQVFAPSLRLVILPEGVEDLMLRTGVISWHSIQAARMFRGSDIEGVALELKDPRVLAPEKKKRSERLLPGVKILNNKKCAEEFRPDVLLNCTGTTMAARDLVTFVQAQLSPGERRACTVVAHNRLSRQTVTAVLVTLGFVLGLTLTLL